MVLEIYFLDVRGAVYCIKFRSTFILSFCEHWIMQVKLTEQTVLPGAFCSFVITLYSSASILLSAYYLSCICHFYNVIGIYQLVHLLTQIYTGRHVVYWLAKQWYAVEGQEELDTFGRYTLKTVHCLSAFYNLLILITDSCRTSIITSDVLQLTWCLNIRVLGRRNGLNSIISKFIITQW